MEAEKEEVDVERNQWSKDVNCKQLFAMIMLSLHFNMAFLGIHAVPSQGCALSGDLCLRTEDLLFAEGVLITAVVFYPVTQLKLKPRACPGLNEIQ